MNDSTIEWLFGWKGVPAYTWNLFRGCSKEGPDCNNCYAMRLAARYSTGAGAFKGYAEQTKKGARWTGKLGMIDDKLTEPIREQRGGWVFGNSMSDAFHRKLRDDQIDQYVAVSLLCTHHRMITLTKRVKRMAAYFNDPTLYDRLRRVADGLYARFPRMGGIAIPDPRRDGLPSHTWWGMSAGDQDTFDKRYVDLVHVPGQRLLSLEPLFGKILLRGVAPTVNWIIVGAESGPGRRPAKLDWVRHIVYQVQEAQGVASRKPRFFFKQWQYLRCSCRHGFKAHERTLGCAHCPCGWLPMNPEVGLDSSHPVTAYTQVLSMPILDGYQWVEAPAAHPTGLSSREAA